MAVRDVVQAAAGVGGGGEYIEDVFSTYLYNGTQTAKTITNGIDLAGEGGMVWSKVRNNSGTHRLNDSVRGVSNGLRSDSTAADQTVSNGITAFNNNGYALGTDAGNSGYNFNNYTYASWTFRKSPKFFDVVTYTGDGTAGQTVSHSLGATPGMIIAKRTDSTSNWAVAAYNGSNYDLLPGLNLTNGRLFTGSGSSYTSTEFKPYNLFQQFTDVPANDRMNVSGATYVAYLFAHDAGGFGDDGEQNIISCGSYTGNGSSAGPVITLGWEPQWVLIKDTTSGVQDWILQDTMRGMTVTAGVGAYIKPNTTSAEFSASYVTPQPTGFQINNTSGQANTSGNNYIYMAIRRPMKTPESGTEVFAMDTMSNTDPSFTAGFPVDMSFHKQTTAGPNWAIASRLTGKAAMYTDITEPEITESANVWDFMDGWHNYPVTVSNWYAWMFKRAPSVFDVVVYTGTGVARTVAHNLGVAPEMMLVKDRDSGGVWGWSVYHKDMGNGYILQLEASTAKSGPSSTYWNSVTPSDSVFNLGDIRTNWSGTSYINYIFASCPGVSKVSSYIGTGADINVDCGFSAGARFILIKRTDSAGDWYVWDSVRGIAAGNDPYMLLNRNAAQVTNTDYIDPLSSGFTVTSTAPAALNASGGSYIFLAIA